jgi:ADP-ribosyl-[dinitrogen reductase] hydrolase
MIKQAGIIGLAVGDALGLPFETSKQNSSKLLSWNGDYLSSKYHQSKPGDYSDDTKMTIMVAQHLLSEEGFKPNLLAEDYLHWLLRENERGMGRSTRLALENLNAGHSWNESGVQSEGNGTCMRASPFGLYYYEDPHTAAEFARIDAKITHNTLEAQEGSAAVAVASALLFDGTEKQDLLEKTIPYLRNSGIKSLLSNLNEYQIKKGCSVQDIMKKFGTKARVTETVPSAFACFLLTSSYEQCILSAIKAGGDTDTTGAVAGGLAGIFYGYEAIPQKYIDGIENREPLESLDNSFIEFRMVYEND